MKKNPTLYAGVLLIVLAGLYFLMQPGKVDTKDIDADALVFDEGLASMVELQGETDTLRFTRTGPIWTLEGYPVDSMRMNQLLDLFSTLQLDRLITRNAEKHTSYQVDDRASRVSMQSEEAETLLDIFIGKQGASYQETFIRPSGGDEVYAVKTSLAQYRRKDGSQFWDRSMTHLNLEDVTGLTLEGVFNYTLSKVGSSWLYNGEAVDLDKVEAVLSPLENLKASNFSGAIPKDKQPYLKITISLTGGEPVELTSYLKDEQAALVLVKVSGLDKQFEYSKSALNRFDKSLQDLLPDPPPAPPSE